MEFYKRKRPISPQIESSVNEVKKWKPTEPHGGQPIYSFDATPLMRKEHDRHKLYDGPISKEAVGRRGRSRGRGRGQRRGQGRGIERKREIYVVKRRGREREIDGGTRREIARGRGRGRGQWRGQERGKERKGEILIGKRRGREGEIGGRMRREIARGRGRGRSSGLGWISNDVFFAKPSDKAIAYGIDHKKFKLKLQSAVHDKQKLREMINCLNEICQSPNRHCVRNVFATLRKEIFFERADVLIRQTTDDLDDTAFLAGNILKSYCSFLDSIGSANDVLQKLLSEIETRLQPRSLDDFGYLKSPADCDLGLILQPGISALYNNPTFEERKITDPFENSRSLLERTFYLHKEDITRPLVRGLRRLKHYMKKSTDLEKFRNDDIRVYRDLQIVCSVASISYGLIWEVQLDTSQPLVKSILKSHRRLLQRGTLVCISNDVFKTNIVYGTIVESEMEDDLTGNGIVCIEIPQCCTINRNTGELFTLVESKSNCLANMGALIAVKQQLEADEQLPFAKQIVHHQQNTNPPNYLFCEGGDEKRISFACLRKEPGMKDNNTAISNPQDDAGIVNDILEQTVSNSCPDMSGIHILDTETWPSPDDLGMDISQYRAFSDGLTQGLALIQGPPGTGKTVMALNMIEVFLNNDNIWSKENVGPIILLSYTNHALDQFLEGIIRMPKMASPSITDIVRVGSRCKTESLDKFNLRYRRKEIESQTRTLALTALHMAKKHHSELADAMRIYLTSLVHERFLLKANAITDHLFRSLRKQSIPLPADKTYLCEWLSIFADDFVPQEDETGECGNATENIDPDETTSYDQFGLEIDGEDFEYEPKQSDELNNAKCLIKCPIPIVTTETNEDRKNGIKYWSSIDTNYKHLVLQEVKRRIMRTSPMSVEEESTISDVWDLPEVDRWRLYKLWIVNILTILKEDMLSVQKRFKNAYGRYKECRLSEDIKILKNARIVAMTTTRAAADHVILRRINSKIMVIEEAAEVPDHHVLASLVPSLQHLVMIGDHQQLRPSYNDYRTAMRYDLNVSIFERLITTGLPFQQLQYQHRMRPEIADLLTPSIYSELHNHESAMEIENVHGIHQNVYFLNHQENEQADSNRDMKSHKNKHEVDFIAQLYRYLRLQGYDSDDITVLTTYKEQERLLKKAIRDVEEDEKFVSSQPKPPCCDLNMQRTEPDTKPRVGKGQYPIDTYRDLENVFGWNDEDVEKARVTTVDNFQGEESKIILLSLVRSNSKGTIGFLKEPNRICVALSRAKAGLYIVGDCTMLKQNNGLWRQILQKAETNECVGTSLTLYCRNHPQYKTEVSNASDFQKVPDGGCRQKCSATLVCGHDCPRMCHTDDPNHDHRPCNSTCGKPCPFGHTCPSKCSLCREKCPPCRSEVFKSLPKCGHNVNVSCYKKPDECICTERCENILECGHRCQKKCGVACNTSEDCNELVKVTADCGHVIQTACHTKEDPICKVKCTTELDCGHVCKGTCRSCFAGHLHQKCREKIQRVKQCGHTITIDCVPAYWNQQNDGNPAKCQKKCEWRCKHLACGNRCGEPCTRQRCNVRCTALLECHHLCELLLCDHNGDHWCRKCSRGETINGGLRRQWQVKNPRHIRLHNCRCIFETEVLDEYLEHQDYTFLEWPRCPNCVMEINEFRYYSCVQKAQRVRFNTKVDAETMSSSNNELQEDLSMMICAFNDAANDYISDVSLRRRCTTINDRLCDRLIRKQKTFSNQELCELLWLVPKMVKSLKCCILISKVKPECMSEKLSCLLEKCGNIYNSNFTTDMEQVQNLEPSNFDEVELIVENVFEPVDRLVMLVMPSIEQMLEKRSPPQQRSVVKSRRRTNNV